MCEVNSADVLEILTPIWHAKAETARAVRQRIRSVLEWAVAMQLRADNPCDRILPVLGPQNDVVQHMRALPHREVGAALATVRASTVAEPAVKLVFEFLVLTSSRSGEACKHRVPLCERAFAILDEARSFGGDGGGLVFPSRRGKPVSATTLPKVLQQHGIAAVPHGFRLSFRD